MASSGQAQGPVNRRIEGNLSRVMGQRDPAGLIRPRSTEPIRACGLAPRHQAGHMTAIGLRYRHVKKSLRAGGHPHMSRGHPRLRAPETKTWIRGSSPRKSNKNRFLQRGKLLPNFVLAGLDPATHDFWAVETKTWIRGSSPRKTNQNRFLRHEFLLRGKFSPDSLTSEDRNHLPLKTGWRFSAKARAASRWSSVIAVRAWCTASISSTAANGSVSAANRLRFM
jgi:hypothetical protein